MLLRKINWNYHIHTKFTDGQNSVDEIAQYCYRVGIKEIAITEHVRSILTYDFNQLLDQIGQSEKKYKIKIWKGIEAKILPNGQLDLDPKFFKKINLDFIVGVVHFWPQNIPLEKAYDLLVSSNCSVIGHPHFLNNDFLEKIVRNNKVLEINSRYPLLEEELQLIKNHPALKISVGTDAHTLSEIDAGLKWIGQIVEKFITPKQIWKINKNL